MKTILFIFLILLISCSNPKQENEQNTETTSESVQENILKNCAALEFLKLAEENLQTDLFHQIDSIRQVQYPNNDQDTCNSVDLTPQLLEELLTNIDTTILKEKNAFTTFYHFNIACSGFVDSRLCKDEIVVSFYEKTCHFRVAIRNHYKVDDACVGGSQVSYGFQIENNKIVDFGRQEAG